jgi:hypothetical protein
MDEAGSLRDAFGEGRPRKKSTADAVYLLSEVTE